MPDSYKLLKEDVEIMQPLYVAIERANALLSAHVQSIAKRLKLKGKYKVDFDTWEIKPDTSRKS